jgi:hypothetical protein
VYRLTEEGSAQFRDYLSFLEKMLPHARKGGGS